MLERSCDREGKGKGGVVLGDAVIGRVMGKVWEERCGKEVPEKGRRMGRGVRRVVGREAWWGDVAIKRSWGENLINLTSCTAN